MDPRDRALRLLDEAMALLELVERSLGSEAERRGGRVSGPLYSMYTNLLRLHEKLVQLRGEINSICSEEADGG